MDGFGYPPFLWQQLDIQNWTSRIDTAMVYQENYTCQSFPQQLLAMGIQFGVHKGGIQRWFWSTNQAINKPHELGNEFSLTIGY